MALMTFASLGALHATCTSAAEVVLPLAKCRPQGGYTATELPRSKACASVRTYLKRHCGNHSVFLHSGCPQCGLSRLASSCGSPQSLAAFSPGRINTRLVGKLVFNGRSLALRRIVYFDSTLYGHNNGAIVSSRSGSCQAADSAPGTVSPTPGQLDQALTPELETAAPQPVQRVQIATGNDVAQGSSRQDQLLNRGRSENRAAAAGRRCQGSPSLPPRHLAASHWWFAAGAGSAAVFPVILALTINSMTAGTAEALDALASSGAGATSLGLSEMPNLAAGLSLAPEPSNALSLPTWTIHVASVVEWVAAMVLVWRYGGKKGRETWRGLTWGMVPLLAGAMCACTWHFFYNAPSLEVLVALQGFFTVMGNCTCCLAAYRIYKQAQVEKVI